MESYFSQPQSQNQQSQQLQQQHQSQQHNQRSLQQTQSNIQMENDPNRLQQQLRSKSSSSFSKTGMSIPNRRKNTKPRSILNGNSLRLDVSSSSDLQTALPSILTSYKFTDTNSSSIQNPYQQQNSLYSTQFNNSKNSKQFWSQQQQSLQQQQQQQQQSQLQQSSTSSNFQSFICQFKKPSFSISQMKHSESAYPSMAQARVTGFKPINHAIPPRVTRLMHAVEDRDTKQSRDILDRFSMRQKTIIDDQDKSLLNQEQIAMQHQFMLQQQANQRQFQLERSQKNIPKIQNLMCHYINNHKVCVNKEVVLLPKYEKSAPFFVETMQFADSYLDDQRIVRKNFGYNEDNLARDKLLLEKIVLERLVKVQMAGPKPPVQSSFLPRD